MKMIVKKERLIELVCHEDWRVRRASAEALEEFFPGSDNVIKHLLQAIDTFRHKEYILSPAVRIKHFTPTEKDLKEILRLFIELEPETGDQSANLKWHLQNSLLESPFQLLEKNYNLLASNEKLLEIYEIVKNREQVKYLEADILWDELVELCNRYRNKKMERDDSSYCGLLVKSLSQKQKGEKIKHKVIMYLSQDTDVNYHLELFLVELAGNLKLRETVPYLFRILIDSDFRDLVRSSCSISLGQIGTPEVVEKIGSLYRSYKDLKNVLAETFKYIPYDYSEEMAVQLLKSETDPETGTFLAGALCDIFSIKSSDMIIDIIRKKQYDPSIMGLLDYLIPVYVYHNKTIDNLAELERREREFQDERLDTHPLFKLRKHPKLSKDHDEIEDEESDSFDEDDIEDIEDSRERKKVMPMSRIPSKKRNKSKKKKKKSRKR